MARVLFPGSSAPKLRTYVLIGQCCQIAELCQIRLNALYIQGFDSVWMSVVLLLKGRRGRDRMQDVPAYGHSSGLGIMDWYCRYNLENDSKR